MIFNGKGGDKPPRYIPILDDIVYELSYLGPVSERLDVDWALLQVNGVRAEVHLTTDVEVHPLGKAHHVVVVHPQRLRRVVECDLPGKESLLSTIARQMPGHLT